MVKKRSVSSKKTPERKLFGIRLTPPLMKKMKALAVEKDTTPNRLIEVALKEYLKKHKAL